jgi:hypothetical protein
LIVKTTFKSHFKIKKTLFKNKNKNIFVKNMIVFFLFSKIFFKNCTISLLFKKTKKLQTNLLKAPSRHKKFFHQICFEFFFLKVNFYFNFKIKIPLQIINTFFQKINNIFIKFGSNVLTRIKFLLVVPTKPNFLIL